MRRIDPLIVGGGPAGASAAIALAQAGARPLILERSVETGDALCGGFLSWQTLDAIKSLGVDALDGHQVTRLALYAGDRSASATLPRPALGVSRRQLDTRLIARAVAAGAGVEHGVIVRGLDDPALAEAETVFLATGKHDLRGASRPRASADPALGLRMRLAPGAALDRLVRETIELHLFDGGYAGLVLQEGGVGNLCLAVRKSRLAAVGGDPQVLFQSLGAQHPALGDRIALGIGDIEAIGAVPYGWIAAPGPAGLFRLGDQAAVIPSLAGEGNGIALASGVAAANAWLAGGAAAAPLYQARFAKAARSPVRLAKLLWTLAEQPAGATAAIALTRLAPWLAARFASATRIRA